MKLARAGDTWFVISDAAAVDVTDLLAPLARRSWSFLCERFESLRIELESACASRTHIDIDQRSLDAPVVSPSKIIGILGNDISRMPATGGPADHKIDVLLDFFLKSPSSLIGSSGSVLLPQLDGSAAQGRVVPECELAVLIGRGGENLAVDAVSDHILGYTIGLDLTARGEGERSRRKSLATFCPVGPWIVTRDELGDDRRLDVKLWVNGTVHQDWSTSHMVFPVMEVVSWVSRSVRLEPGDLILTGAPQMTRVLESGDLLHAEIDGIGALEIDVADSALLQGGVSDGV
ncbi:MAG: 2-keto-4-pentenoate hydratase/2-oxohepta-3-ene-1,7-dioic acid hydratase in catechol pathway [Candidatus Azotimanducaceae bacterium]|jgi:2-keto-4-pentenoate hydratase/2-oxohepta-3-ene-1,7-dioic acid hydratase in catechol pathway|tara:strand:- start:617 stop:1486 length:870 start_codon:yes stop_codon:yes gene_type:complete